MTYLCYFKYLFFSFFFSSRYPVKSNSERKYLKIEAASAPSSKSCPTGCNGKRFEHNFSLGGRSGGCRGYTRGARVAHSNQTAGAAGISVLR